MRRDEIEAEQNLNFCLHLILARKLTTKNVLHVFVQLCGFDVMFEKTRKNLH